jgi:hypothetical protein
MARNYYIIDTNVLIAANGHSPQVSAGGVERCQKFVNSLFVNTLISIDSNNEIFDEYFRHMNFSGQPGIGDSFVKYLFDRQADITICETVEVIREAKHHYRVLSDKPDLLDFDKSDLKFIAVHLLSKYHSPIVDACDSDWAENKVLLNSHNIKVIELLEYNPKTKKWSYTYSGLPNKE